MTAGRRRLAAAVTAASLLVLASCGGDEAAAAEAVRAAPDKTVSEGSSRVAVEVTFPSSSGTGGTARGDGLFDLRSRRGTLTLDLAAIGVGGAIETVVEGENIYVKLPSGVLPGSRPWYRFDLSTLGQQAGLNLGSLGQLQLTDPSQVLRYLRGASDDMREVGEEQVRGTTTTHYRGTVDLRRAAESLPDESKQAMEAAISSLGTSKLPSEVWIDGEGRLRKMSFSLDADGSGPAPPGSVLLELYEFGVPVDVQVPPPDQVSDLSQLVPGSTIPR